MVRLLASQHLEPLLVVLEGLEHPRPALEAGCLELSQPQPHQDLEDWAQEHLQDLVNRFLVYMDFNRISDNVLFRHSITIEEFVINFG